MKTRVTILGCGGSTGTPMAGNIWGACDPNEPRNYRRRPSILVEQGGAVILVDTAPELREQLNMHNVERIDAVLYTHSHADHVNGIDDLRPFHFSMRRIIDVFGNDETMNDIRTRFPYMFGLVAGEGIYSRPFLKVNPIGPKMTLAGVDITSFEQDHTVCTTIGYRFGRIAYSTDVAALTDAAFAELEGIDTWILGVVRREPHVAHVHLSRALEWIERLKPRRTYLTHMNHTMDYASLMSELPPGIEPAYDGLVLEVD